MSRSQPAPISEPAATAAPALGYLERSERPLTSLVFLLPLIVLYEAGTRLGSLGAGGGGGTPAPEQILAFSLMRQFFQLFGANGRHLPALAVVGILLTWHIARRDEWKVSPRTLAGMAVESLLLGLPLIALWYGLSRYFAPAPLAAAGVAEAAGPVRNLIILSLGAGVYEELVFRLILFTTLSLILRDLLGLSHGLTYAALLFGSSVLFAAYHLLGLEAFHLQTFVFRTMAGIYFGGIFLTRGFGITAASHAAYDVLIVTL